MKLKTLLFTFAAVIALFLTATEVNAWYAYHYGGYRGASYGRSRYAYGGYHYGAYGGGYRYGYARRW